MHPLNVFFDKVFLITIDRGIKRLNRFKELNPTLDFEIFNGIDGKLLFPELTYVSQFPKIFFEDNNLLYSRCACWNKGQLGCAMSNLLIQKKILELKLNRVLILEDDAFIIDKQLKYFVRAMKEIPENWELLYLGFNPLSRWSENTYTRNILKLKHYFKPIHMEGLSSGNLNKRFFSESFSKLLNKPGVYGGTHAYALSYLGAKKIVALDSPLQFGFDTSLMYMNYHSLLNSYSLKTPVIIPNEEFETSLTN